LVGDILLEYHRITQQLKQGNLPLAWLNSLKDIREQLASLIYAGFISQTPSAWLIHFPRYLKAIGVRLSKLQENPSRDQQRCQAIAPLWQACCRQLEAQHPHGVSPTLLRYRWLLEEYRVSLFAQELGTAYPVSAKRLECLWKEI
jgi:ATP-dependent helicase HrpA